LAFFGLGFCGVFLGVCFLGFFVCFFFFFLNFSLATGEYPVFTAASCYCNCTLAFNNVTSSTAGSTQEEERSLSSSLTREHGELQELSWLQLNWSELLVGM